MILQIRVSSEISNGAIILNVDCDMYSNNSDSIRDALCFFMDEEKGHEIAFVQCPQNFENITKNELYSNSLRVIYEVSRHREEAKTLWHVLIFLSVLVVYEGGILWFGWPWRSSVYWNWLPP